MKHALTDILDATLTYYRVSHEEWSHMSPYRVGKVVLIKQVVSFLATECGYHPTETGKILCISRSTVIHHNKTFSDMVKLYDEHKLAADTIRAFLDSGQIGNNSQVCYGYLARGKNGLLTISTSLPEEHRGFWLAMGTKPFYPQNAFPQVTYETGPIKVRVKITIEDYEKM